MNYAVINAQGLVVNTIVWDGTDEYDPGDGLTLEVIPDGSQAGIGWTYINGAFVEPS